MSKNILFLVTGMTPQIITETIWALACDPANSEPWIPDEVRVLSTSDGLDQIRGRLFKDNNFQLFIEEYSHLNHIKFDEQSLISIKDKQDEPLKDLKTPEDNELAADMICEQIKNITADDNVSLHVSIAGGRKTMGFYAGYALSLYGRAQDKISHVLVDEKYEKAVNFFYPSNDPENYAKDRDGKVIGPAKDAQVWLAQIPFVRMREAIQEKHQLHGSDSFSQVVDKINESFNDVSLLINLGGKSVTVNEKFTFTLPPRQFAFLHWFSDLRLKNLSGIIAPTKSIGKNTKASEIDRATQEHIGQLTSNFIEYYEEHKDDPEVLIDKKFFESVKSLLKASLEKELGLELASKIAITQQSRGTPFYLNVPTESIKIIDSFK